MIADAAGRAVAIRYGKTARDFLGVLRMAAAMDWLEVAKPWPGFLTTLPRAEGLGTIHALLAGAQAGTASIRLTDATVGATHTGRMPRPG